MFKSLFTAALVALCLWTGPAAAAEPATFEEAKALATKAAEFLKKEGPEKAFPVFDANKDFTDRELYVFVYDNTGTCVSIGGGFTKQIGKNLITVKDVDGVYFIKDIVETKETNTVKYKWPNPLTKQIGNKTAYIVRATPDYVVGVGIYE